MTGQQGGGGQQGGQQGGQGQSGGQQQDQQTRQEIDKLSQQQRQQFDQHKRDNPHMSDRDVLAHVRQGGQQSR